jgi:hypothetical protein
MKKIFLIFIALHLFALELYIKKNNAPIILSITLQDSVYKYKNSFFSNKSDIVIKYKDSISAQEIKDIESRYNLTFKQVLINNNFIYAHNQNILSLLKQLINEENIKNVYPNWEFKVELY